VPKDADEIEALMATGPTLNGFLFYFGDVVWEVLFQLEYACLPMKVNQLFGRKDIQNGLQNLPGSLRQQQLLSNRVDVPYLY
jgi:hypothetical protein